MGTFSGLSDLHGEVHVPDPAADQSCVKDQGLHKAVPGAPEHLVFFRLLHAAGRVGAAVDGDAFVIAVDEKAGKAGEKADQDLAFFVLQAGLSIGNVFFRESVGRIRHIVWLYGREALHDPQEHLVLG